MSENKSNQLIKSSCDNLINICDILPDLSKLNEGPIEAFVEELFSVYFRSLFSHYDEEVYCNRNCCRTITTEATSIPPTDKDLWIFGYGSLVWKADFPFIDKKQGYIEGYQRRFFQHSIDHRGTPESPGRVVTLIPSDQADARVYGVAYRIAKQQRDEVLLHLDYREKNGYQRSTLRFVEFCSGNTIDVIMYIATNENESFAGGNENDLEAIANQIYTTAGPSGPNREYLYYLAEAMRELFPGILDDHLFKLEKLVKQREQRDEVLADLIKSKIREILMVPNNEVVIKKFNELLHNCRHETYLEEMINKIESSGQIK